MAVLSAFIAHPWIVLGCGAVFFLYVQNKSKRKAAASILPALESDALPADTTS